MKIEYSTLNEFELVERLRNGEKEAFDEIYKRHSKYLIRYTYKRTGQLNEVDDLVQDLFVKLWTKKETLVLRGSLQAFLTVCIRNVIIDKYHSQNLRHNHLTEYPSEMVSESTQEHIAYNDLKQFLQLQISRLPEKMQEVFILRKVDDLSIDEISEKLSLSKQTIKNQLHSAVSRLRISYKSYFWLFICILHFAII